MGLIQCSDELSVARHRPSYRGVKMPDQQEEILRWLHETYARALWRFVTGLTKDHAEAEDVVQETLIGLWKHPAVLQRP
jgi:RNA polymerase sigma-70 factor (ECF subfamily)